MRTRASTSSDKRVGLKGLGITCTPQLRQPLANLAVVPAVRQHDHPAPHPALRQHRFDQFHPVQTGHVYVRYEHVYRLVPHQVARRRAVPGFEYFVPLAAQPHRDQTQNVRIVLGDQYSAHRVNTSAGSEVDTGSSTVKVEPCSSSLCR